MASIIDTSRTSLPSTRTLDISGESYGYIVSHDYYGQDPYRANITRQFRLTNFIKDKVEITFKKFDIHSQVGAKCSDYVEITTPQKLRRLCSVPAAPIKVDLSKTKREITFTFHTDHSNMADGFWMEYNGMWLRFII